MAWSLTSVIRSAVAPGSGGNQAEPEVEDWVRGADVWGLTIMGRSRPFATVDLPPPRSRPPWSPLVTSLPGEYEYAPDVEGTLPPQLRGTLLRNGPGLFERGGLRKRNVLDGDGMVHALRFGPEGVRYRNRFVRTEKFVAEQRAGAYRYATWTTQHPGGWRKNLLARSMGSQAGVALYPRGDGLLAFDDGPAAYVLEPDTLDTRGPARFDGVPGATLGIGAHAKLESDSGSLTVMGGYGGLQARVRLATYDVAGRRSWHRDVRLPGCVYMHDFMLTRRWVVLHVHPVRVRVLRFLLGQVALSDAMDWDARQPSRFIVVPRDRSSEAVVLEGPASFMWHAVGAYDRGDSIVAHFVGYDDPDHFLGADPQLSAMMRFRPGSATSLGVVRRLLIEPSRRRLRHERLSLHGVEFPRIDPRAVAAEHHVAWLCTTRAGEAVIPSGVARVELGTGRVDEYRFEPGTYCNEPIPVVSPGDPQRGWLLVPGNDPRRAEGAGFVAVFAARQPSRGPVARVWLRHHLPYTFHGCFIPA